MNIYEQIPVLENDSIALRPVEATDCDALLQVYGDKNALPFFNSDNCDGDIFYYATKKQMDDALAFWATAYQNKWFARLAIVDKTDKAASVIGTVELCLRASEDVFNGMGILRVDVGSSHEQADILYQIFALLIPHVKELLGCQGVITKVPSYAVERTTAVSRAGFKKSEHCLIGKQGYAYDGYWQLPCENIPNR